MPYLLSKVINKVCKKLNSVLLFISHDTLSQTEEKWQKQLQCSEPVVAVAAHPLNDWLLAGTQVHILVLKIVLIYRDDSFPVNTAFLLSDSCTENICNIMWQFSCSSIPLFTECTKTGRHMLKLIILLCDSGRLVHCYSWLKRKGLHVTKMRSSKQRTRRQKFVTVTHWWM